MARLALAGRCWCCYWCWTRGGTCRGWSVLLLNGAGAGETGSRGWAVRCRAKKVKLYLHRDL